MKETAKNQGEVGWGKPPKEYQFKKGESGNPKGHPKGLPNRSTIARQVLSMIAEPPEAILKNLKMMYPKFFEKRGEKWTNEFLITLRIAQKAMVKGDVRAYEKLLDSAYGKAKQQIEADVEGIKEIAEAIKKLAEK